MAENKKTRKPSLLDGLIGELMNTVDSESLVDLCLSGDRKQIAAVPLRYRLIALGFVKKMSLEELNQKLLENDCEGLYARSLWEATLIYAFKNKLSYPEWKELISECGSVQTMIRDEEHALSSASLSMADLNAYVSDNSVQSRNIALTQHKTRVLSDQLSEIGEDRQAFRLFLLSNVSSFSTVREKTRYYFCKYLLYFLNHRMGSVIQALENNQSVRSVWEELSVFRIRTVLDRKKHTPEEAKEKIFTSALSFGEIYEGFERFYFEYITQDWLQVLLNYYGKLQGLTTAQKKQLTAEARKRNKDLKNYSDDKVIDWLEDEMERREREADSLYALDNKKAVYQRGRGGENFLRKVLRGELDLDRITFVAFLLFFGREAQKNIPAEHQMNPNRLSAVLQECGFPTLDQDRPSDFFFIDFMKTDDPMMLLMEEAETMAFSEENFYLYKTYLSSENTEKKWNELMQ